MNFLKKLLNPVRRTMVTVQVHHGDTNRIFEFDNDKLKSILNFCEKNSKPVKKKHS